MYACALERLWFTGFYDHSAWCPMFGVKSFSSKIFKIIVIVIKTGWWSVDIPNVSLPKNHRVGKKDGAITSVRWLRHTRGVIATPNHPTNADGDNSVVHMLWHTCNGVVVNPLSHTAAYRLTCLDTVACRM